MQSALDPAAQASVSATGLIVFAAIGLLACALMLWLAFTSPRDRTSDD